jgi:hypothetical protein
MATQPPPQPGGFGPVQPGPYAQPAFPQQPGVPSQGPGWGVPPMGLPMGPPPPPPKPSNGAKAAGVVLAVVLGLGLVAGTLVFAFARARSASDAASRYHGPTYTLTLPATLLDGRYTRGRDLSDRLASTRPSNGGAFARQVEYKGAVYTSSTGDDQLLVTGLSSKMTIPSYPKHSILDGMEDNSDATVEVPRRAFRPDTGEDPLECEVLAKDKDGLHLVVPVCSWIDGHTQAAVTETGARSAGRAAADVDLEAYAKKVARVRSEVRIRAAA